MHRTARMRQTATRKHPEYGQPIPEGLRGPEVIPTNALLPLGG
jgi:hypothetical protein